MTSRAKTKKVFSAAKLDAAVLKALRNYRDGLSSRRLNNYVFQGEYTDNQIFSSLKRLYRAEKVVLTNIGGGGTLETYTLKKNAGVIVEQLSKEMDERKKLESSKPKKRGFFARLFG